ncbi:hypothetical protein DUI70_0192 [Streptomyces albus]|nr:hypothetical protein DUI70_0192 [Streptomyces albus]
MGASGRVEPLSGPEALLCRGERQAVAVGAHARVLPAG